MVTILYDFKLKKVGCALLQAAYGTTINSFDLQRFGVENWLTFPTKDLKVYVLKTKEELERAIRYTQGFEQVKISI